MFRQQFAIHPMISKFPNKHFYNGLIEDGPTVMVPEYNKEFSIKLPAYCFMDVPFGEMKPTRKTHVNAGAIFLFLQSFCKGIISSSYVCTIVPIYLLFITCAMHQMPSTILLYITLAAIVYLYHLNTTLFYLFTLWLSMLSYIFSGISYPWFLKPCLMLAKYTNFSILLSCRHYIF